jgi:hypothetical protein
MNMQSAVTNALADDDMDEFANAVFDLARAGSSETLYALLAKGLSPNLRSHRGDSLLMLAAYHGHLETVRVLLKHGANPHLRNANGTHDGKAAIAAVSLDIGGSRLPLVVETARCHAFLA